MNAMVELVRLSVGEPDFPTPDHIKKAGRRAIAENFTRYTPQPGFDDLRQAICQKFRSENGINAAPDQIVVSCGGKHSLYNVIQCAVQPGDEVILFGPHWFAGPEQVRRAGGKVRLVPALESNSFGPDPDAIRRAITRSTKAIVLNSPCNPTGAVYSRQLLSQIANLALEHNLLLISDEVYEKMVYDGAEHVSIGSLAPEIAARTVTINSVSKTHAMTGWRIGYAVMPVDLARRVTDLQSVSTSGPCAVSQRAALAAITGDQSHVDMMVSAYAQRRRHLMERVARIEGFSFQAPAGALYLMADMAGWIGRTFGGRVATDADTLADIVLEHCNVQLLSCSEFGAPGYIRFSFAISPYTIDAGMDRLERLWSQ